MRILRANDRGAPSRAYPSDAAWLLSHDLRCGDGADVAIRITGLTHGKGRRSNRGEPPWSAGRM